MLRSVIVGLTFASGLALSVCPVLSAEADSNIDTFTYERARRVFPKVSWGQYHGNDVIPAGVDNWRRINPDGIAFFSIADTTDEGGRRFEAEGGHNGFVLAAQPIGTSVQSGRIGIRCDVKTPANWVWYVAHGVGVALGDAGLWTAGHQQIGGHTLAWASVDDGAKGDWWYRVELTCDLTARTYDVCIREIGPKGVAGTTPATGAVYRQEKGLKIKGDVKEVSTFVLRAYDCGGRMPEGRPDERICFDNVVVTVNPGEASACVVYENDGKTRIRRGAAEALAKLASTAHPKKIERVGEIDFAEAAGTIRAINGINGGPSVKGRAASGYASEFAQLKVASVRLHDIPLVNSGIKLVDVQDIFPVWNDTADVHDAANYFFASTDDYLKTLQSCGVTQVVYRLGTSIEWSYPNKYFAKMPKNPERYAEICAGIVRHYAKGWAGGPTGIVTHWEIWNEANIGDAMWDKSWEDYVKFYVIVAKRLKREFPNERIGGPALCGQSEHQAAQFMDAAKAAGAPVDFFSWHGYDASPSGLVHGSKTFRRMLDERGFPKAELHFNEWHYFPCTWNDVAVPTGVKRWSDSSDGLNGIDSAAFTTLCLTAWQEAPLDMSNFYMTTGKGVWALFDMWNERRRTWYAMEFFGRIAGAKRVKGEGTGNLGVIAGVCADGRRRILVSDFLPDEDAGAVRLRVAGVAKDTVIQAEHLSDAAVAPRTLKLALKDGILDLPASSESSVWLLTLE